MSNYSEEDINNIWNSFFEIVETPDLEEIHPEVTIVLLFVLNVIVNIGVVVLAVPIGNSAELWE